MEKKEASSQVIVISMEEIRAKKARGEKRCSYCEKWFKPKNKMIYICQQCKETDEIIYRSKFVY